ncbi:uncharacterized protein BYT42DRAFT_553486 [Radiomyces spectabilis]|uniref:uncharacterized protein n=1 Tax=Radiomyces spectabilis TaxID=64574 RepID=UPI0022202FF4|nr:uncharacterized protein BYT42DRAFT_553486 [Radiomyces spectabilis]KAI8394125.1 hypothetical protein BYT42DRAFT_553486 [Radiomyces spectabilis]
MDTLQLTRSFTNWSHWKQKKVAPLHTELIKTNKLAAAGLTKIITNFDTPVVIPAHESNVSFTHSTVSSESHTIDNNSISLEDEPKERPPTPPPKDRPHHPQRHHPLLSRPLPPLPANPISTLPQRHHPLRRAVTCWISKSVRYTKSLTSHNLTLKQSASIHHPPHTSLHPPQSHYQSFRKTILSCKVMQITNLTSSRDYSYELDIYLNDAKTHTIVGSMKKIAKGVTAATPRETVAFTVNEKFCLTFVLKVRAHYSSALRRMKTLWPSLSQTMDSACSNWSYQVRSGNRPEEVFASDQITRYMLCKDIELAVVYSFEDISQSERDRSDMAHCAAGDYLTFYVQGASIPMWVRYWVTLDTTNHRLLLRRLSNEHKAPVHAIPLASLRSVHQPSDETAEEICLDRQQGLVLRFNVEKQSTSCHDKDASLGYIYLLADSKLNAIIWLNTLNRVSTPDDIGGDTATVPSLLSLVKPNTFSLAKS